MHPAALGSEESEGSEMGQREDKRCNKGVVVVTDLKLDALSLAMGVACQPDFWGWKILEQENNWESSA